MIWVLRERIEGSGGHARQSSRGSESQPASSTGSFTKVSGLPRRELCCHDLSGALVPETESLAFDEFNRSTAPISTTYIFTQASSLCMRKSISDGEVGAVWKARKAG